MKRTLTLILILILCATMTAFAQTETAATTTSTPATATAATTTTLVVNTDSAVVRQQFRELLDRHPPTVGRVLKMDPTLFSNQPYLTTYPALAAFLAEHPEIAHTPAYYLEGVYIPGDHRPETAAERIWSDMVQGISIFFVITLIVSTLAWVIRTLIAHRRWSRLSRVQTEVHGKLMDRFATNEELMNYIATPAGKRFLELAPLQLDDTPRPLSIPISRILISVQIGLVLGAAGIGMIVVSTNVPQEIIQPLSGLGTLAISLGVGFVLSAVISYILSRRLGLWTSRDESSSAPTV
jgi:hypothetical protein